MGVFQVALFKFYLTILRKKHPQFSILQIFIAEIYLQIYVK